jgi:hypothetical protein
MRAVPYVTPADINPPASRQLVLNKKQTLEILTNIPEVVQYRQRPSPILDRHCLSQIYRSGNGRCGCSKAYDDSCDHEHGYVLSRCLYDNANDGENRADAKTG